MASKADASEARNGVVEDAEDAEWGTWEEDESVEVCKDLFSKRTFQSVQSMLAHCRKEHDFDVDGLRKRLNLDIYGSIMLVNFVRSAYANGDAPSTIMESIRKNPACFRADDRYLKPFLENDVVLTAIASYDDEDAWSSEEEGTMSETVRGAKADQALLRENEMLKAKLASAQKLLQRLTTGETKLKKGVEDVGYFGGYSHYGIHEEMLKDRPRTEGYRNALEAHASKLKGKIVLDVGCGTGILSLFAARAGARHVIGIDRSDIIDEARKIVEKNGYSDRITLIKGKLEDVVLPSKVAPDGTVDVIVSEWMGYMLLFESMLPSVLVARDRWLAKDEESYMFPSRATMSVCAVEDHETYKAKFKYWQDVYGFDMNVMRPHILAEPYVEVIDAETVASNHCKIFDVDIMHVQDKELDFRSPFALTATRTATIHGILIWFDVAWPNEADKLTTRPEATPTHWKQTLLFLETPIRAKKGDVLRGTCALRRGSANSREYTASLVVTYTDGTAKKTQSREYHMAA